MDSAKNLRPWKPGQSGNPGGRPRVPESLRKIISLTQDETCKIISKYARMTSEELIEAKLNPKIPALDAYIISIFTVGIETGDHTKLSFLLERAIGKVPIAIESPEDIAARQELQALTDQELIRIAKTRILELEASDKET